jgi:flavin prenyltransferase
MPADRLVIAISGASGAPYALNVLAHLCRLRVPIDLIVSPAGAAVLRHEVDGAREWLRDGVPVAAAFGLASADVRPFSHQDLMAPCASGTALRRGMVVVPCSSGTLARVAAGVSASLIERAADVCLKERRPLVLVHRETPLSLVHIKNMQAATEAGAIVLPASPGFYHGPRSVEHLLDHVSAKILDVLGIEHDVIRRWGH